ncbi:DNA polymerase II [Shewanella glacialipiscicola]|uniref:DNA polymerase II n=1 Tax=Shewanella glacialipiscicola TaxID=614069 RepID=UPI0021D84ABF|nr:DNA polymerase II [Shewanella glacialipiscicola]MCU7996265.1 DNA polymerase II [Shewanella glacialipiscicola]MCU8027578.1 DNA polymerase II [Shewanella glacialipiscicola]
MKPEATAAVSVQGRVITRHAIHRHGNLVLQYYLATAKGPVLVEVQDTEHICFCHQADVASLQLQTPGQALRFVPLALKSFKGGAVSGVYTKSSSSLRTLQRIAKDADIPLFEADIRPEQRYLIERFVALDVAFLGHYLGPRIDSAEVNSLPVFIGERAKSIAPLTAIHLCCISLDFECSFEGLLYSVGLYGQYGGQYSGQASQQTYEKVIMVGEAELNSPSYIEWVADEAALIHRLIAWFHEFDPDFIIGWSVVSFDLALLSRRALLHRIPLTIGRGGAKLEWKVDNKFRPETLSLPGRVVLDGIDWLKAAFYHFERFSLEFVSRQLLGEGKAIHNVDNRVEEIDLLFKTDKQALAHYNLTDSRLVWDIFTHTQLWDFALARAELTGLELGRVGASVAAFNHLYLPHLHRAGYVAPDAPASDGIESPGGYVMDSVPGLYKHILVFDFKSLYPSIIRTFLIDPKGLVEGLQLPESECVAGFLGGRFSRQQPILPKLIQTLSEQREKAKREYNAPLSQAIKIIMNSLYGVLGSQGCVFHDAKLASSITMRGHQIMKQTRAWIEEMGYQVIYGDTDSTFVWLGSEPDLTDISALGQTLADDVNAKWYAKITEEHQVESFLELQFERHYEQFFMPTLRGSLEGSKKRYVGAWRNASDELELVFKGMEQVRSDWSPLARKVQASLYERMFNQRDISVYLAGVFEQLLDGQLDDDLVFRKRMRRNIEDYTAKSSPHVKVAQQLCDATGNAAFGKRGAQIDYLITVNGPESVEYKTSKIDYQYYIDKQIGPIAEPVFSIMKLNYMSITSKQLLLI